MRGGPVLLVIQGPHHLDANGVVLLALGQIVAGHDEQDAKEYQHQLFYLQPHAQSRREGHEPGQQGDRRADPQHQAQGLPILPFVI